ncbi:MAG: RNA polymerase sigma factor RpoD/SigA [Treponema sp.]
MSEINNIYRKEIEKISLLSAEEEKTLAAKAYSGDKTAQDKLVEANLRLVIKIAGQYKGYMDFEDLVAEGNIGLITAAKKFDPARENKFCTYAMWWIKASIQLAIREKSTGVRFPAEWFEEMKKFRRNLSSLDKVIRDDEGSEAAIGSFLKDEENLNSEEEFCKNETLFELDRGLKILNCKERTVILKRFGLDGEKPMSLSQVGTLMGYSRERIRQIEKTALVKLRQNMTGSDCMVYFAA